MFRKGFISLFRQQFRCSACNFYLPYTLYSSKGTVDTSNIPELFFALLSPILVFSPCHTQLLQMSLSQYKTALLFLPVKKVKFYPPPVVIDLGEPRDPRLRRQVTNMNIDRSVCGNQIMKARDGVTTRVVDASHHQ